LVPVCCTARSLKCNRLLKLIVVSFMASGCRKDRVITNGVNVVVRQSWAHKKKKNTSEITAIREKKIWLHAQNLTSNLATRIRHNSGKVERA